ncbi:MAG: class B sortase [Saccharofermentans sp.]|nr:class B sortase [Saccharofermentans sp.]
MSKKRKAILCVLLLICLVALGVIAYTITKRIQAERSYDVLRDIAHETTAPVLTEPTESTEAIIPEETYPSMEVVYDSPINFVELQRINPEIYAWIETAGGAVSYPVLQHRDDYQYYLNHTFDDQVSSAGSIFTEGFARHDFMDPVTVVYRHNMRGEGYMFGSLRHYREQDYFDANRDITIYTPTDELHYTIFAAVTYTNALISYEYEITTVEGAEAFINHINDMRNLNNIFADDVEVNPAEDHILVLSTCNGNSSQRFLVLAVLQED